MSDNTYIRGTNIYFDSPSSSIINLLPVAGKTLNVSGSSSSTTLANGTIPIGNASNVSVGQTISGDSTISNTGVLTLTSVVSAQTSILLDRSIIDVKGRTTGFVSTTGNVGQVITFNTLGAAVVRTVGGDVDSTGGVGGLTLNVIGSVISNQNFSKVSIDTKGRVTGLVNSTLNSGQVLIGNISNIPTGQTISGDATIDNGGILTISDNGVSPGNYTLSSVTVNSKGLVTSINNGLPSGNSGTIGSLSTTSLTATSLTSTNMTTANLMVTSLTSTGLTSTNITTVNLMVTSITGTSLTSTSGTIGSFKSTSLSSTNLISTSMTATGLTSTNITTANLMVTSFTGTGLTSTNITTVNLLVTSLTATGLTSTNITTANLMVTSLTGTGLAITNAIINTITNTNLLVTTGTITNCTSSNLYGNVIKYKYCYSFYYNFGTINTGSSGSVSSGLLDSGAYTYSAVCLTSGGYFSMGFVNSWNPVINTISQVLNYSGVNCTITGGNTFTLTNTLGSNLTFGVTFCKISSNNGIN